MAPLRLLAELTKVRVAALSTLTGATGYLVFARAWSCGILFTCAGIMLLAMGACALNEVQERRLDRLMTRTWNRPIPSGRITMRNGLLAGATLVGGGFLILFLGAGLPAALLGLAAAAWYNGAYTYLKRATAFAVVPGAVIGAFPPAIGWVAAGGSMKDPRILALSFFFFMWQVPHFWLLVLRYGEDYKRAGFPSLKELFGERRLARLTCLWMLATTTSCLLLPIYHLTASAYVGLGFALAGILPLRQAVRLVRDGGGGTQTLRQAFYGTNVYALLVMGLLALDTAIA